MLGFTVGCEVATEAHGYGAGGDFCQAGEDYEVRGLERAGEAGGKGEGDGEAVGEADDDVADDFAGACVPLVVLVVGGRLGDVHAMIVGSVSKPR